MQFTGDRRALLVGRRNQLGCETTSAGAVGHQSVQQNIEHACYAHYVAVCEHRNWDPRAEVTVPDRIHSLLKGAKWSNREHDQSRVKQECRDEGDDNDRDNWSGAELPVTHDQRWRGGGDEQKEVGADELRRKGDSQQTFDPPRRLATGRRRRSTVGVAARAG